jgi:YVTN family beta-propeller protein
MATMLGGCKTTVCALLLAFLPPSAPQSSGVNAQTPGSAGAKPPAPPAVAPLPFAAIKPDAAIEIPDAGQVAATARAVWVTRTSSGTVARLDPATNAIVRHVAAGVRPCGSLVTGLASLWVHVCGEAGIARLDPEKNVIQSLTSLHPSAPAAARASDEGTTAIGNAAGPQLAVGVGSLWTFAGDGTLVRIDPDSRKPVAEVYLPKGTSTIAFDADALWTAGADNGLVTRVDPHTNLVVETIKVGKAPGPIAIGEGAVWVLNRGDGSVSRIDPKSNRVTATVEIGKEAAAGSLAAAEGSVWLSAPGLPLVRIDPRTNRVAQKFIGDEGGAIAAGHKSLWLLVRPGVVWRIDPRFVEAVR